MTRATKKPRMPRSEQGAGEAAGPVEQAGVALDEVAEEASGSEQRAQPGECADAVVEEKGREAHAVLAGDGWGERGQAGNELGDHQGDGAAAAKGVLGAADADGGFERHFAENAQDMVPVAAANEEPGAVGDERGGEAGQQGERES